MQTRQQQEYEVKAEELSRQLERSRQDAELLRQEAQEARRATEEAQKKLAEADRGQSVFASNAREEHLEQEIRKLRRQAAKGGNTDETQALKKELMDYVRFILKLLPPQPASLPSPMKVGSPSLKSGFTP